MASSALFGMIDGLVTAFTAAVPAGVTVLDGPDVKNQSALDVVIVGCDDLVPGDYRSGREEQGWAGLGGVSKDARGTVVCALYAQTGAMDIKERRNRAAAILAACELALRNDIDLDGGSVLYTGLESVDLRQQVTTEGAVVRIVFVVNYRAKI